MFFYSGLILKRKSPHALKLTVNSAKEGDNTTEFPWYCVGLSDFPMFCGVATENLRKFCRKYFSQSDTKFNNFHSFHQLQKQWYLQSCIISKFEQCLSNLIQFMFYFDIDQYLRYLPNLSKILRCRKINILSGKVRCRIGIVQFVSI